jgi:hypothetical protein
MKPKLSREELIKIFASDYGYGPDVTNHLTTEHLQQAYESESPYNYIKAYLSVSKK